MANLRMTLLDLLNKDEQGADPSFLRRQCHRREGWKPLHLMASSDHPGHVRAAAVAGTNQGSEILVLLRRLRAEDGVNLIKEQGRLLLFQQPDDRRDGGIDDAEWAGR